MAPHYGGRPAVVILRMRPVFSSFQSAVAFALLLLVLLLLPVCLGRKILPPRQQLYDSIGWNWGAYPCVRHAIFDETNDIDLAFIGSSHMACAMDVPEVQRQLSARLGRPAVVRSVTWNGADFDVLYLVARDLLEHRRVKMLVFYDESLARDRGSVLPYWFRWGEDAGELTGLPISEQVPYYYASVLGIPHNLLCYLRPNLPADLARTNSYEIRYQTVSPADWLGGSCRRAGFGPDDTKHEPFQEFVPQTVAGPGDACIYSPATKGQFEFLDRRLPAWQQRFAERFAALVSAHGCRLVLIHLPTLAEVREPKIREIQFWPQTLHAKMEMLGVPPGRIFGGLSDAQCRLLFADPGHLNENGQRYFTPLVLPSLFKIYDEIPHS